MANEVLPGDGFDISRLKPGTKVLVESDKGSLYSFRVINSFLKHLELISTDAAFKTSRPQMCNFAESWAEIHGGIVVPNWIVRGYYMIFRTRTIDIVSGPVKSALLEGPGWSYEAIESEGAVSRRD